MGESPQERFFAELRKKFIPLLRQAGFSGSGKHFRRITNEVIQALSFRGDHYGGKCYVDLGMHLSFLPTSSGKSPKLQASKAIECEFRLSPPVAERNIDGWLFLWGSAEVDELTAWYFKCVEPVFKKYESLAEFVNAFSQADLRSGRLPAVPWWWTQARTGLVYARIHKHLGNMDIAREFALFGLQDIGSASALKSELESLSRAE